MKEKTKGKGGVSCWRSSQTSVGPGKRWRMFQVVCGSGPPCFQHQFHICFSSVLSSLVSCLLSHPSSFLAPGSSLTLSPLKSSPLSLSLLPTCFLSSPSTRRSILQMNRTAMTWTQSRAWRYGKNLPAHRLQHSWSSFCLENTKKKKEGNIREEVNKSLLI